MCRCTIVWVSTQGLILVAMCVCVYVCVCACVCEYSRDVLHLARDELVSEPREDQIHLQSTSIVKTGLEMAGLGWAGLGWASGIKKAGVHMKDEQCVQPSGFWHSSAMSFVRSWWRL